MKLNKFKRMLVQKIFALVLTALSVALIVANAGTAVLIAFVMAPLGIYLLFTKKQHVSNAMVRELAFWFQCTIVAVVTVVITATILLSILL